MHGFALRLQQGLLAWGLVSLAACHSSVSSGPVDGAKAMEHVRKLVSFSPRPAGSGALAKAGDWLEQELKALGLKPRRDEFTHETEKLKLRNIWAQIDGDDPAAGPILVLGAHYDTKLTSGQPDPTHNFTFLGAIDGSSGPAVLLELARVMTKDPKYKPKVNVWLLFIDGEESVSWDWGHGERALLGSKHFVKIMSEDKKLFPDGLTARMKAFVLLDLIGSKDFKIDRDLASNKTILDIFEKAALAMGAADRVFQFAAQETDGDDHQPFLAYGVPAVDLIDIAHRAGADRLPEDAPPPDPHWLHWWHTAEDKIENMSPDALAFVGNLVLQAWPDLEAFCRK